MKKRKLRSLLKKMKKDLKFGMSAGVFYSFSSTCFSSLLIAVVNSRTFPKADFIKFTLFYFMVYLIIGVLLGFISGVISGFIKIQFKFKLFTYSLPWIFFLVLFVTQIIIAIRYNNYIFQIFIKPSSLIALLFLIIIILLSVAMLVLGAIRFPSTVITSLGAIILILAFLVFPFTFIKNLTQEQIDKITPSSGLYKPTGLKIILIGLDGMDWKIADQLLAEGALTNLEKLIRKGSRAALTTFKPTSSPIIWTSIATGKHYEDHGIKNFIFQQIPFTQSGFCGVQIPRKVGLARAITTYHKIFDISGMPINNSMRREKAFWNIFTEQGIRSAVINWSTSWPAEKVLGLIVTDRVIFYRDIAKGLSPSLSGLTYPSHLISEISSLILPPDLISTETFLRYMDICDREIEILRKAKYKHHTLHSEFPYAISQDESIRRISLYCMDKYPEIPIYMIYTRGIDILSHAAMKYSIRINDPVISDEEKNKYGRVLDEVYKDADKFIGDIMSKNADPNRVLIVVSDHGFEKEFDTLYNHHNAPKGVLVISGGPVMQEVIMDNPSVFDIAPTVLYLAGLPVPKDMPGRVLAEVIDPEFKCFQPIRYINTYGPYIPVKVTEVDSKVDEKLLEHLRTLGYIK